MKIFLITIFIVLISNITNGMEIKIIHKIQNQIITNVDIKNEMRYLLAFNQNLKELDRETIFNISNESLIKQKIKKIEIKRKYKKNNLSDEYLAMLIKEAYSNLGLNSFEEFDSYLKKNNLDIVNFKEKITIQSFWNQLIFAKYNNQVTIDKNEILKKLNNNKNNVVKEYQLSEIIFKVKNKDAITTKYNEIIKSIEEIGFENSASKYSLSESSISGGDIGWINENSLIDKIRKNIINLDINEISNPIILSNGILLLKVNNLRETKIDLDINAELNKAVAYERNRQLKQYSDIYFNKIKKNLGFDE